MVWGTPFKRLEGTNFPVCGTPQFCEWGASRWRIQWAAEGVLNARVDVGVGELQMVRSRAAGGLPSEIWRFP